MEQAGSSSRSTGDGTEHPVPTPSGTASVSGAETTGTSSSYMTGSTEPPTPVPAASSTIRDAPTVRDAPTIVVAPRYSDDEKALEKREWEVAAARDELDGEDTSALLNLPPPPPFDLKVDGLTVGVPHHKYERVFGWVPV